LFQRKSSGSFPRRIKVNNLSGRDKNMLRIVIGDGQGVHRGECFICSEEFKYNRAAPSLYREEEYLGDICFPCLEHPEGRLQKIQLTIQKLTEDFERKIQILHELAEKPIGVFMKDY
jgi:hypothetical protein